MAVLPSPQFLPPKVKTPTADDIERQLRLKGIGRVLRKLGLMRLEDTEDVGLENLKVKMGQAPQEVLGGLRKIGRNPDSETFLKSFKPDIDEGGLNTIFGIRPAVPPAEPPPLGVSEKVTAPMLGFKMPVGELKPLTADGKIPPPQPTPLEPSLPKEVPTFSQWAAKKGFNMAEYGSMLKGRGVAEADIPEMLLTTQKDLKDVYEFEFGLGRWGTAAGELEKIVVAEPQRLLDVGKVLGQSLTKVPRQLRASIFQASQGQGGASVVDRGSRLVELAETDLDEFAKEIAKKYPDSKLMEEISRLPQNIAFSLTSIGAGVVTGVPVALAPVPGARIAAWGIGSAASGAVAYSMTTYQIMQEYLEAKNEEMIASRGSGITAEEEAKLKKDFEGLARAYGLWEAVPEAISNLAFSRLLTAPLTRIAGKSIATRMVSRLAGIYGEELLTETITQKGQATTEIDAGLREGNISWAEAFKEIAPQTFLLTTILGGTGALGVSAHNRIRQSLRTEVGDKSPVYQQYNEAPAEMLASLRDITPASAEIMASAEMRLGQPKYPATPEGAEARAKAEGIPISEASRLNAEDALSQPQPIVSPEAKLQGVEAVTPVTPEVTKEEFQQRLIAAQDLAKEASEQKYRIKPNSDGSVTIYHGTSSDNAKNILSTGKIERQAFFSPNKVGAAYYGKTKTKKGEILSIKVDARDIEYSTGTGEIFAPYDLVKDVDGIWKSPERVVAIPKAEPGMPEAGLQPSMLPEEVAGREVRPRGKGQIIQISMEDQLKLEQARKAAKATPAVTREAEEAQAEIEVIQETLQTDPVAQARFRLGGRNVDLAAFISIREGNFPDYFTVKQAEALFPGHDFSPYTQKGTPQYNHVPRDVVLDDLTKRFNMTSDEIADRVMQIRNEKTQIRELQRVIKSEPVEVEAVPGEGISQPPPGQPPTGGLPPTQPPLMPGEIPVPGEGKPRTLTDLNREARGMRALTPEERAGVMDMAKPIAEGELLYKVKPFNEHGDTLLQPDKPINKVLRSVPGIKQATEIFYPGQMERDNPVALIGIKKRIFEEIETGRARLASLKWWYQAKQAFDFKKVRGKWRATNIELSSEADPAKPYHATIHDLVEHPENYVFTEQQQKVLVAAQDMQNQILRDAQRVGVDAVELSGDYWRRIVTKAPKNALFDGKIKSRITQKKGYTRQRAFDFVDDGAKLGFEYETHPLRSLQNRLEAGIRTISDQSARKEIAKLPGIIKPLERLESRYPQTIEGVKAARQVRDDFKTIYLADNRIENEQALRQAEADYVMAMREFYFKKIAAGQPNIGELKLPNGRISPVELADEISRWVELPEIRTGRGDISNRILEVTQLLRSTLTNVDLAAGFIQGQALFYRNNLAWWIGQGNAIQSLVDDRMAYVEKNFDVMDEGMRMGAISIPTEFMFTSQGIASIPTRVPVVGPVMKAFNRAFEWFIVVGQTELYKAARSGVIKRATGANVKQGEALERQAIEALTSLGSAIRKEMGTESYAILGVRPTQHTIEQLTFFAARFFRALVGIQAQTFTTGEGGREARRAMGALIAGGLALLIGIVWVRERKLPNMTDPFASDWMQFKIGKTYFNTFGPFYPYFRALARASFYLAHDEPVEVGKVIARFLQSKEGLLFRGIDMAAQFAMYGSYRTFEGKRLPATPLGIAEAVLGEMAVPISIQEAMTALPEGRYESVIGEIAGLVGRDVREEPVREALSKLGQIDQEALDQALEGVTNPRKIAEMKEKDWTFDIQSVRKVISSRTKNLSESRISQLNPIVRDYWQFAEQKDEYEILSTEEKKKYLKTNPDFVTSRLFWGELTTIPGLRTAEALAAMAKKHNIALDMIPAFQLTDKGKERIPSNRDLWQPYFDYYDLPSNSYLNLTREQVDAGELPEKYRKDWEQFQKLTNDRAKTAFKKVRNKKGGAAYGGWRDDFRRENTEFDEWLQENEGLKPLTKKSTRTSRANVRPQSSSSLFGGFRPVSGRRRKLALPKFPKVGISTGVGVGAPRAPRV